MKIRVDPLYDRRGADWIFWWGKTSGHNESGRWISGGVWHGNHLIDPMALGRFNNEHDRAIPYAYQVLKELSVRWDREVVTVPGPGAGGNS